ncbi:MAG: ribonuclease III [Parvimonas sp.]|uniref:ribonuclease III n=1 Tax=Parvimonas sp. TaxID=1944660 RepID=UPI0025DAD705|nr:ribonuclease III [Parvimonas sp.]MCI5997776.1 ribonuclease III [Parvimonas sp.]MDY3050911.1 ribonuclease III [Parvimonas sp.]
MKISNDRLKLLRELMDKVQYKFKDIDLLNTAFIHRSYLNENKCEKISNERLEFLGDIIIGYIVSVELYNQFPDKNEGFLTKIRSKIVCEESFAFAARELNLGKYLLLGKGEDSFGGRDRNSILADTFEAFFGAVYLDGGIETVERIVNDNFFDRVIYKIHKDIFIKDYKSSLQEFFHKNISAKIKYCVCDERGPDHNKEFDICVMVNDEVMGRGTGKNKKQAEQNAAKNALIKLGVISE